MHLRVEKESPLHAEQKYHEHTHFEGKKPSTKNIMIEMNNDFSSVY